MMTALQLRPKRLHNWGMNGQAIAIQSYKGLIVPDEPDDSLPPPIIMQAAPPPDDQETEGAELAEAREKSKLLKPLFSNRVYIEPVCSTLRISFGERVGGDQEFHSCIVMPLDEAMQTGDLLFRMANAMAAAQLQEWRAFLADLDKQEPSKGGNG